MCEDYEKARDIVQDKSNLTSELKKTIDLLVDINVSWESIYMALHKAVDLSLYEYEVTQL